MAIFELKFEFDSGNKILMCRVLGEINDDSILTIYRQLYMQSKNMKPTSGILDLTEVMVFDVNSGTLAYLAEQTPAIPDPAHPRVVVAPTPLIFGMARMFQLMGDKLRPQMSVVRTMEEAYAFIAVESPKFEPLPPL